MDQAVARRRETDVNELQRLAALVARTRLHRVGFHGVLAPHAVLRAAIVTGPAHNASVPAGENADGRHAGTGHACARACSLSTSNTARGVAVWRRVRDHCGHRGARADRQDPHAPWIACASPAALPGAGAGPVPGGLILEARAVLQRGRRSGATPVRTQWSNGLGVKPSGPIQSSQGIAGGGILTRHPCDRRCARRYRRAGRKKVFRISQRALAVAEALSRRDDHGYRSRVVPGGAEPDAVSHRPRIRDTSSNRHIGRHTFLQLSSSIRGFAECGPREVWSKTPTRRRRRCKDLHAVPASPVGTSRGFRFLQLRLRRSENLRGFRSQGVKRGNWNRSVPAVATPHAVDAAAA